MTARHSRVYFFAIVRSAIGEAVPSPNDVFTTFRIATAKSGSSGVFSNGLALFVMAISSSMRLSWLAVATYKSFDCLGALSLLYTALSGTLRD